MLIDTRSSFVALLFILFFFIVVGGFWLYLSDPFQWWSSTLPQPTNIVIGPVELCFSQTYYNDPSIGEKHPRNIDRRLEELIDDAEHTVDIALFEIESKRIANALLRAAKRQVKVRVVSESDYADNPEMQLLESAGIPTTYDHRSARMHNKFLVVDSQTTWTGSYNFTDNGAWRNNNNAVVIRSVPIAINFLTEFEEMFERKEFGPNSTSNTPQTLTKIQGMDIYTYFSPEDDVAAKIYRLLRSAKSRVRFMAFRMTDDSLGTLLIQSHLSGLDVEGIVDGNGVGANGSEIGRLRRAGLNVRSDQNRYAMHHKVIVIDGVWTILGSYNFTDAAAKSNDENLVIIKSQRVSREFEKEYERVLSMKQKAK